MHNRNLNRAIGGQAVIAIGIVILVDFAFIFYFN